MKIQTRQRGFGLIEIVLALGIISLALSAYIPWQARQEQKKVGSDYAAYVSRVISGVQEYQYWQISRDPNISAFNAFPAHLRDLMKNNGQWWAECSENDYKQKKCLIPDEVPWNSGSRIRYNRVGSNGIEPAFARITLPLGVIPAKERGYWKGPLIALPYAKEQPNGDIKIKIYDPMLSQFYKKAFDSFIKKDGSTELTRTWDVGNQSILNAKKFSVRTQTGTQLRIDAGTVKEFLARHNDRVYKSSWSCPEGLRQTIHVSAHAPMAPNSSTEYVGISTFKPYAIDRGAFYELKFDYNAKIKSTGKWARMHSGFLNVRLNCDQ